MIELRGDEALAVFDSPRQAIRAATLLQQRFLEETETDPMLPLPVGIGLDAGEAVPLEGGYRGGALNLAARLCSQAGPGEILASQAVVHLARKVEGVSVVDRGPLRLKGLEEPIRVFRVISDAGDPAERVPAPDGGTAEARTGPDSPGAPASRHSRRGGGRAPRRRHRSYHVGAARRRLGGRGGRGPGEADRRRRRCDDRPAHRDDRGLRVARVEARRRRRGRGGSVGDPARIAEPSSGSIRRR